MGLWWPFHIPTLVFVVGWVHTEGMLWGRELIALRFINTWDGHPCSELYFLLHLQRVLLLFSLWKMTDRTLSWRKLPEQFPADILGVESPTGSVFLFLLLGEHYVPSGAWQDLIKPECFHMVHCLAIWEEGITFPRPLPKGGSDLVIAPPDLLFLPLVILNIW